MYAIYAYIGVVLGVNVGIYMGVSGLFGVNMSTLPEIINRSGHHLFVEEHSHPLAVQAPWRLKLRWSLNPST